MNDATQRLRAFEEFIGLVTERRSRPRYVARLRGTLNPFLANPDAHVEHVDTVLELHSAALLGSQVPWTGRWLGKPAERSARRLPRLIEELQEDDPARRALEDVSRELEENSAAHPRHTRRALDAFLLRPAEHARHVDVILEAYAAGWLASVLPFARPLVPRAMRRGFRHRDDVLDPLLKELRQRELAATGRLPVAINAEFNPLLLELPLAEGYAGYVGRFRLVLLEAHMYVEPEEGFRLRRLTLDVGFRDEVRVLSAGALLTDDGSESDLTVTTSVEHVSSRDRSRTGRIDVNVKAPFVGGGISGEFSSAAKEGDTKQHKEEARQVLQRGMRLQATRMDNTGKLQLRVEEGLPVAGDGGLPFDATLSLNVLIPAELGELDASLDFDFEAGDFPGTGHHEERLTLRSSSSVP